MSAILTLLVFLDSAGDYEGWLLLDGEAVAARGSGVDSLPVHGHADEPPRIAAIVPGEAVTIHWLEVPAGLAPAQAVAAARLTASEMSAQPLGDLHVAVGGEVEESGLRAVAIVPALAMIGWLARLQKDGINPDSVLPEPLLLLPPQEGFVRYDRGGNPLFRGRSDAFAVEAALAQTMLGDAPVADIDRAAFEAGLAAAVRDAPVDLRQGAFAKRRAWSIDWPRVRRMAMLALAILVVTLAIQLAAILRYTYAADAAESEAQAIAAKALPRDMAAGGDAAARLSDRLADLRGGGPGFDAIAATIFDAVRATANAELAAMTFDRDGSLRATIEADTPATIDAFQQRVEAAGLAVTAGAPAAGGGRPQVAMTVRAK